MITQLLRLVLLLVITSFSMTITQPLHAQDDEACPTMPNFARSELIEQTITSGDVNRIYYLYIPASYDPQTPAPLVLAFHGFAQGALGLAGYSGWEAVAEEHGFVLVYPQGNGAIPRWESGLFVNIPQVVDDVAFVSDMITTISETLCIDTTRVYANGLSNGGGMSYRLACELSDQITAIGGVAGAYTEFGGCTPNRPVPIILFHGDKDSIVPYMGNNEGSFIFSSIADFALSWAERNGCDLTAQVLDPIGDVSGVQYTTCDDNADVVFYTVAGGGHTWPGAILTRFTDQFGGYVTQDMSASETMWEFFARYQLDG
jgi:polyhydroxybutyrate depolymerase